MWYNCRNMRVYLDNCCYNRPFDDQGQLRVRLETLAKLQVQALMRDGKIEYVWSDTLVYEVSKNPFRDRQQRFLSWIGNASVYVHSSASVVERGREFEAMGLKPKDALHVASAERAECDWFVTTDKCILKKLQHVGDLRIGSPIDFMMEDGNDQL